VDTIKCNEVLQEILRQGNLEVGKLFNSEVIVVKSTIRQPIDDEIKDEIEELMDLPAPEGREKPTKLTVLVETNGGYIETVERIVSVFRQHYQSVEYVVPNYAYSAGTILVLSGDELWMDYYSVLGPIDPQVGSEDGSLPGMGYLAKFEELVGQINDPTKSVDETRAQVAYLIKRFDPAKLFIIEQAIEHSKALLRDWLPKYKFKAWTVKETSQIPVTPADREQRANEIADALGDARHWHSHGRGVGIKELASDLIKLQVKNYGEDETLRQNISQYYGLLKDYMSKNRHAAALHTRRGLRRL
jgi:serine dehydrogenase proteinase